MMKNLASLLFVFSLVLSPLAYTEQPQQANVESCPNIF